jgi:outer membrane receptor protein involved in Fe transport
MGISKLDSRHIGGEISAKFNIMKGLKADFAASYGVYKYVSDANIALLQENINEIRQDTANMKGLFIGNTPQLAITAGGIYESPLRFWLGLNLAYTGQSYPDINPVTLSHSYMEAAGNTREQQTGLNGVFTFNLKGGYVVVFGAKRKKALSLNVHAQNLFDAKGILGAYSPYGMENNEMRYAYIYGRTVYLMLRFSF